MKRMVCVINKDVADELDDLGFRYMVQQLHDNQEVYTFIETDKLHKELNNKKKYSKRDWYYSNKMMF